MCYKAFLLISFVEAGLFESLLDLYFGIPISFLQNSTSSIQLNLDQQNMISHYHNLSYKTLNLFSQLFSLAVTTLNNEYSIDNFNETLDRFGMDPDSLKKFYNQGVYYEYKRSALVVYLNKLDDQDREREVLTFVTEFIRKEEKIKSGSSLPVQELSRLSFFRYVNT